MSMSNPPQRPALRKAADASVHPTLPAAPTAAADESTINTFGSASDTLRDPAKEKRAELVVEIPKSLRKRLRKHAERSETTADAIVEMLLRAYLGD